MDKDELRSELEDHLIGNCFCDYITKSEMYEILDDFDKWAEDAKSGDIYYYDGCSYELTIKYEIGVWKDISLRETEEPVYITPKSSTSNLDLIKKEVEEYDIGENGYVEIFQLDNYDTVLCYEKGQWTDLTKINEC